MTGKNSLSRARLIYGQVGLERLANTRVLVFGVGGVGSWCVESLVRSGVGHITIVDSDRICESNINRQMMATSLTVGMVKVEAMRNRLLEINPDADISVRAERYEASTADSFDLDGFDYIVDCIDSLKDKALLIERATRRRATLFSSMGAALKTDPTRVAVAEFWKVKGCPLARALRNRFKREHCYPARKFKCVYSEELVANKEEQPEGEKANGSLMHITAIFGLTLSGLVLNHAVRAKHLQAHLSE